MKKRLAILSFTGLFSFCCSCIPYKWIEEDEPNSFNFSLHNRGKTTYEYAVVFAKDSTGMRIDSSHRENYQPGYNHHIFNTPGTEGVGVGISLPNLVCQTNGVFEAEAKILNGKVLRHEFGSINNPRKGQNFVIEFWDSTIVVR